MITEPDCTLQTVILRIAYLEVPRLRNQERSDCTLQTVILRIAYLEVPGLRNQERSDCISPRR